MVIDVILKRNPEFSFSDKVDLDVVRNAPGAIMRSHFAILWQTNCLPIASQMMHIQDCTARKKRRDDTYKS